MKFMFSLVLMQYIGYSTASFYTNLMLYYVGLRKSVLLIGVMGITVCMVLINFGDEIILIVAFYFVGVVHQAISILTILFFIEKHKRVAAVYYSKSLAGQLIGAFIWNEILTWMVNPDNVSLNNAAISGDGIGFYDINCVKNVEQFLNYQASVIAIVAVFVYYHLPESKLYAGILLKRTSFRREDDSYKSFQATLQNTTMYFNIKDAKGNEILSKFARKEPVEVSDEDDSGELYRSFLYQNLDESLYFNEENSICTELHEYTRGIKIEVIETMPAYSDRKPYLPFKDIFTKKFILLFLTSIIRNSQSSFMIDSLKVHGNFLSLNDNSLNHLFSIAVLLALVLKGIFFRIWDKFGVTDCYCFIIVSNIIFAFLSINLLDQLPSLFYPTIIYSRTINAFNVFSNSMTLYTTYKQSKAIQLSQVFELHRVIAIMISIGVNYTLVDNSGYEQAYTFYLLLASAGLIVLILVLRSIISRDRLRRMFY